MSNVYIRKDLYRRIIIIGEYDVKEFISRLIEKELIEREEKGND